MNFYQILKIKKINKNYKEVSKKEQEHTDLFWFTLPQGLRLVPYSTVRISSNRDQTY